MNTKKISFGFSKINRKPNLLTSKTTPAQKEETKVELVKCLEGQEIKLVDEKKEETPLVIPMKESNKTSSALLSLMKRRAVLLGEEAPAQAHEESATTKSVSELKDNEIAVNGDASALDQRAVQELLNEVTANNGSEVAANSQLVLPVVKPDDLPLDGAKEPSFDDYESVPIEQYGMAMLRGMGWVPPPPKKDAGPVEESPQVRPKGMGLGADKALKLKPLLVPPEANEVLEIKKHAYVRILAGKHKDLYGQIEGFDDHAGRVIVKMVIGGNKEAFNEFLCQPVSRKEYSEYGKCINTAKYEEYKKLQNEHGQIVIKQEPKKEKVHIKVESAANVKTKEDVKRMPDNSNANNSYSSQRVETRQEYANVEEPKADYKRNKAKNSHAENNLYDDERRRQPHCSKNRSIEHRSSVDERREYRRSRSTERITHKSTQSHSSSKSRQRRTLSSDSSISSQTSDSDSAYERKHKKAKSKRKSKKSKSKSRKHNKHHRSPSTDDIDTDTISSSEENARRRHKSHKKKTKKSKKPRSRTRSRSRTRR